jgi:hypothetical protein
MLNKKLLLFASVIMATAADKEISTPQTDIVITDHPNYKGINFFKIVNYRKTTLRQIDNLTDVSYRLVDNKNLDEKSKTQVCNELKKLATHYFKLFEKYIHHMSENCVCECFPLSKPIYMFKTKNTKHLDKIYNESMLKEPSDFQKFNDDLYEILEASICRISHDIIDGVLVKELSMDDVKEYYEAMENFMKQILLSVKYLNTIGQSI